jgi:hypothetical protein
LDDLSLRKQCGQYFGPKAGFEGFDSLEMGDKLMYKRGDCGTNAAHVPGHFARLRETDGDLKRHVFGMVEPQAGSKGVRTYMDVCPQGRILEDHRAPSTTDTGEHDRKTGLKAVVVWRGTVKIARFACTKRKYDVTNFWNQKIHGLSVKSNEGSAKSG